MPNIQNFINTYFHHFNSRSLKEAAHSYKKLIDQGGEHTITAGAIKPFLLRNPIS